MSKQLTICFLILAISGSFLYADWGSETRLTYDDAYSRTSQTSAWCVASNVPFTNISVVWYDNRYNAEIYYKRKTPFGWEDDERLTYDDAASAFPCIALVELSETEALYAHVVWMDQRDTGGPWEIYYIRSANGGSNWGSETRLTYDAYNSQRPCVAGHEENLHVVWQDNRHWDNNWEIYYKRSTDSGSNWGNDTRLTYNSSFSLEPSVAVVVDSVHMVWYDYRDSNYEIYYKCSTDGGSSWGSDTRLTSYAGDSKYPCVAASGSIVHVVWQDYRDANTEIYYKRKTPFGWGSDVRLTYNDAGSGRPSIAVVGDTVHVTWQDTRDDDYPEIYYMRSDDAGINWDDPQRLTYDPNISGNASVAASGSTVDVVWQDDRHENEEIYYIGYTPNKGGDKSTAPEYTELYFCRTYTISSGIKLEGKAPLISPLCLKLYDVAGREVSTVTHHLVSKQFSFTWKPNNLSSGVYFVNVSQKEGFQTNARIIWIK